jgi:hypothetical protein
MAAITFGCVMGLFTAAKIDGFGFFGFVNHWHKFAAGMGPVTPGLYCTFSTGAPTIGFPRFYCYAIGFSDATTGSVIGHLLIFVRILRISIDHYLVSIPKRQFRLACQGGWRYAAPAVRLLIKDSVILHCHLYLRPCR